MTRCAGSASTGTRARRSAARTRRTGRASGRDLPPTWSRRLQRRRARVPLLLHRRTSSKRAARGRRAAPRRRGLRRPLPRAHRRASGPRSGRRAATPVVRFRMPDGRPSQRPGPRRGHASTTGTCPTSCSCGPTAIPLYTLAVAVDDALMGITHVVRGEDLLLVDAAPDRGVPGAMGMPSPRPSRSSGTCRSCCGEDSQRLSKRNGVVV